MKKIFRIDDISVNTNDKKLISFVDSIFLNYPDSTVLLGISPLVCDMSSFSGNKSERIFPSIYNAHSDHRIFYNVKKCGISNSVVKLIESYGDKIKLAGHGIVHVDHRLLGRETQEMSVLVSCSIVGASYFIPPFNKWNKITESICQENSIELIKFEDGWKHLVYEDIDTITHRYYFHTHDFTPEQFEEKISRRRN